MRREMTRVYRLLFAVVLASCTQGPRPVVVGEDACEFCRMTITDARFGGQLFNQIGCAICHVPSIMTAPAGTIFGGGALIVPPALGGKVIHPFSDFLLHDVGTGDGIVQNGDQSTANKLRTPPLWGVRTRTRLMHDGLSLTYEEAIRRHGGEAAHVIGRYQRLDQRQRMQLIRFLRSL